MKDIQSARLRAELKVWFVLAVSCAAPSAIGAAQSGYRRAVDWLAIATGVALAAWLFARTCAQGAHARYGRPRLTLRAAAMIKAGAGYFALAFIAAPFQFLPEPLWWFLSGAYYLDLLTGLGAVALFGHAVDPIAEYLLVLLTTLVQGAAIVLEIVAIERLLRWLTLPRRRWPPRRCALNRILICTWRRPSPLTSSSSG